MHNQIMVKRGIDIACEFGHSTIVRLLLNRNDVDIHQTDDNGISALAIADKKLSNNIYMDMVMISMKD